MTMNDIHLDQSKINSNKLNGLKRKNLHNRCLWLMTVLVDMK